MLFADMVLWVAEQNIVLTWGFPCSRQNLRALGRRFCHLAELLAEHLPLCYLTRESRKLASFYKLQFCRGVLSM